MTSRIAHFADPRRWGIELFIAGVIVIFLFAGTASRNSRALFLTDGAPIAAKAFVATVPSLTTPQPGRGQTGIDSLALLRPTNAVGARRGPPGATAPGVPDLTSPTVGPTSDSFLGMPGATSSVLSTGIAGPPPSLALTPPGSSFVSRPASPIAGGPGATAPPANPPVTVDPNPPVTVDPVSAVPEPNTWAMMILGFFAIGAAVRSRAAKSAAGSLHLLSR
jgi:hypothetical protein